MCSVGVEVYLHSFLTSALDVGELSASHTCRFNLGERNFDSHWKGGWVSPRAGVNAEARRKISQPIT
jgi:hypothetical protein